MSDEQKQDVGEIIADVLMNLDPDTKSAIDYYGSDFTWDIVIGAKKMDKTIHEKHENIYFWKRQSC